MYGASGIGYSPYQNFGALSGGQGIGSTPSQSVGAIPTDAVSSPQATSGRGGSFAQQIGQYISQVNDMQVAADNSAKGLVLGDVRSMHAVMIAGEEANLALSTVLQARNKALDAYHEIMRMQV